MKKILLITIAIILLITSCSQDFFWFEEEETYTPPQKQPLADYWTVSEDSVSTSTITYSYQSTYTNSVASPYDKNNTCKAKLYMTSDMILEIEVLTENFYHDTEAFEESSDWMLLIKNVDSGYRVYQTMLHYNGKRFSLTASESKDIINVFLHGGEYQFTLQSLVQGEFREKAKGRMMTSCELYFNVAGLSYHIDNSTK